MLIKNLEFANACCRSRDEIVRAINAANDAAALAHRKLSVLHAARAVIVMSHTNCRERRPQRIDVLWLQGAMMH